MSKILVWQILAENIKFLKYWYGSCHTLPPGSATPDKCHVFEPLRPNNHPSWLSKEVYCRFIKGWTCTSTTRKTHLNVPFVTNRTYQTFKQPSKRDECNPVGFDIKQVFCCNNAMIWCNDSCPNCHFTLIEI